MCLSIARLSVYSRTPRVDIGKEVKHRGRSLATKKTICRWMRTLPRHGYDALHAVLIVYSIAIQKPKAAQLYSTCIKSAMTLGKALQPSASPQRQTGQSTLADTSRRVVNVNLQVGCLYLRISLVKTGIARSNGAALDASVRAAERPSSLV